MKTALIFLTAFGAAGAVWYLYFRHREEALLCRLRRMVDQAAAGSLTREKISETQVSALENSLKKYLDDSLTEDQNRRAQRDSIQRMISDIAHQSLTPVSNLKLYGELLAEEPGEKAGEIAAILSETEKLDFLIQSLVKLSRMENGIIAVRPRRTAVSGLLNPIRSGFGRRAGEKGIRLAVDDTSLSVLCDPKWTAEALNNLVDNAIKYTGPGGQVSVTAREYSFFTRIAVSDTGIGIREEEINKIFSRFYRSPSVADLPGVGIGLYLSREIIRAQRGYIKVSSRPGEGSVFSVFLPAAGP